ncbi:MAG: agmatine deiminase family protein [Phycisphaerales bacterium JB065]
MAAPTIRTALVSSAAALCLMCGASFAASQPAPPQYPEGEAVPRSMTPEEQRWVADHPIVAPERGATQPPSGHDFRATAEYEPVHGICMAWEGSSFWTAILREMAVEITTKGNAFVYIACDTTSEANSVRNSLSSAGADMDKVQTMVRITDSIWIRDYGPRYMYQGNVRAVVDHTYNRPRPNDNTYNAWFAQQLGHAYYELPLVHGGGNYHLNSQYTGFSTELIANENPSLTESEIRQIWLDYQGIDTQITDAYPSSIDSTQHIDMWLQVIGPQAAVISDWPFNSGSTQDQVADALATQLIGEGWTITRVPARSISGTHYTYTNVVMCNDIVLVPTYTVGSITQHNQEALDAWAAAMPDKTIIPINCQDIVYAAGVMHCITMHIPAHLGGDNPTAYLETLRGGETLDPGDSVEIRWLTDTAEPGQSLTISIDLSTDGGKTYTTPIASGEADDGSFLWSVPDIGTSQARIRVTAVNGNFLSGSDASVENFTITGTPLCPGDGTGDGAVDLADLNLVLANFGSSGPEGDVDGSGGVDLSDLNLVLANFGC